MLDALELSGDDAGWANAEGVVCPRKGVAVPDLKLNRIQLPRQRIVNESQHLTRFRVGKLRSLRCLLFFSSVYR